MKNTLSTPDLPATLFTPPSRTCRETQLHRLAKACGVTEHAVRLLAGRTQSKGRANTPLYGTGCEEHLLFTPSLFRLAYHRARIIEHDWLGGHGSMQDFSRLLRIVYQHMLREEA